MAAVARQASAVGGLGGSRSCRSMSRSTLGRGRVGWSSPRRSRGGPRRFVSALAQKKATKPKPLSKAASLGLISKAESLGLIGLVEDNISLSQIEKLGLLSTGEAILYDRSSPAKIQFLGLLLAAVGAGSIYFIPDDSTGSIALQAVLGGTGLIGLVATSVISSILSELQK